MLSIKDIPQDIYVILSVQDIPYGGVYTSKINTYKAIFKFSEESTHNDFFIKHLGGLWYGYDTMMPLEWKCIIPFVNSRYEIPIQCIESCEILTSYHAPLLINWEWLSDKFQRDMFIGKDI